MSPFFDQNGVTIYHGEALEMMRTLPDASVHAVVTDPPYGLAFMGKKWDYDVPAVELWREVLRVLKPGGHLLSFGGTRTYHRMVVNAEDAGFEVRDMVVYHYASGFPKSLDVSKAIDKMHGAEREVVGVHRQGTSNNGEGLGTYNFRGRDILNGSANMEQTVNITAPATDDAKRWAGFGTALKPATEPILLARKPFPGTVAANVLEHGTGALNVDGCRIATKDSLSGGSVNPDNANTWKDGWRRPWMDDYEAKTEYSRRRVESVKIAEEKGRWPANLIHDGSEEVTALFPVTGPSVQSMRGDRTGVNTDFGGPDSMRGINDLGGSAARFFYTAKASSAERGPGNRHPTVKPIALMRYLCRLVTPPGGVLLDPFGGSGTTALAARLEGFSAILCERDIESVETACRRLECEVIDDNGSYTLKEKPQEQPDLFTQAA